jgi:hypothetical protein
LWLITEDGGDEYVVLVLAGEERKRFWLIIVYVCELQINQRRGGD